MMYERAPNEDPNKAANMPIYVLEVVIFTVPPVVQKQKRNLRNCTGWQSRFIIKKKTADSFCEVDRFEDFNFEHNSQVASSISGFLWGVTSCSFEGLNVKKGYKWSQDTISADWGFVQTLKYKFWLWNEEDAQKAEESSWKYTKWTEAVVLSQQETRYRAFAGRFYCQKFQKFSVSVLFYSGYLPAASWTPHFSRKSTAARIAVKIGIVKFSTVASRRGSNWMLHTFPPTSTDLEIINEKWDSMEIGSPNPISLQNSNCRHLERN